MSISTQTDKLGPFIITGLPQVIPISFPFQSGDDLIVYDTGASGTTNDPALTLTLNSDYSVSGGGYDASNTMQVGSITVVSGGANSVGVGDYIVVARNVPINQTTSFQASGPLTIQMVEQALDKQATISQQVNEVAGRALRFEESEFLDGTLLRSARAGKLLGFDADGNISFSTDSTGSGGSYTAGAGLALSSNEFSVLPDQTFDNLTVTNPIVGDIAGNADTATALETARTINGVSFDGTADVTVPAAAGTLTGTTLAANVVSSSLTSVAAGTIGTMVLQNANAVNITGGTINGATVTGLANGTNPTDAVNLSQLQGVSAGIILRTGVVAATTANITLSAPQTIDGQAVIAGNRVLVKNQTAPAENGIYVVAAGAWSRATDSDTAAELLVGYTYFVSSGTTLGASTWSINVAPTTINVSPVGFVQFSASQSYSAGFGLSLTGNVFALSTAGITINAAGFNGPIGTITPSTGSFTSVGSSSGFTYNNAGIQTYLGSNGVVGRVGTQSAQSLEVVVNSTRVALFTSTGLDATDIGTTTPGAGKFNLLTRTGTSTTNSVWGVVSDATTYNMLTLNNVATQAGMLGISGGGGTDKTLYYRTPAAGGHDFRLNNSTIATISTYGLAVTGGVQGTGVFNVRNYGALGDGTTVDTTAIAAAVAAAKAYHGVVYFPAGIYKTGLITITGAAGLTIYGDGMGVSVIKTTTASQVLNVSSSSRVNVHHLTFDGSCTTRTAGQQGVVFDAVQSSFCDNEIINAGEYAFFAGSGATEIYDLTVSRNYVHACYADGINFQYVTRSIISNNIVDGSDDDCIALGYNGSGATAYVNVVGNFCRARSDLGTNWGRGILAEQVSDCTIVGNVIDTIKQTGIFLNNASGTRVTRVHVIGNTVRNAATSSGHAIACYGTTDCELIDNVVVNPAQGSGIELADWQGLTIQGGSITQSLNVFGRGIHADEGGGWAASWDNLRVTNVAVNMTGAATNSCVYLNPDASVTMNTLVVSGVTGRQVVAGDYITIGSARTGTKAVVANNITLTASRTINVSTGGVFTVTNNN